MRISARMPAIIAGVILMLLVCGGGNAGRLGAKERKSQISPNDPTVRLYNLLDSKYQGKLENFCVLADMVTDPKIANQTQQHVLCVDYDKGRGFGKLNIHVRTVARLSPAQLKAYSPEQIYNFGEADSSRYTKTDPGPFGKPGDVYFETASDGALVTVAPTPEVTAQYESYVTKYIMPALEKKTAGGSGS